MNFQLVDIEAYLLVVESGSISAAARRSGLAKSILSKRVARLEQNLGTELLRRSARGVTPSDRGEEFYRRARGGLHELEAAAEVVSSREQALRGELRITAPMTFGTLYLGRMLFPFLARHPALSVTLDFDDRILDITRAGYDLAIRITRDPGDTLKARRLAVSRRIVCASPGYIERHGRPQRIEDLPQHRCIGYSNLQSHRLWQFAADAADGVPRSLSVPSTVSFNNGEAMRDAAIAGLGIIVLPLFIVAEALRRGELVALLPNERPLPDPIYAAYPATRYVPTKVRLAIDHLIAACGEPPPWERDLPDFSQ
ncbi:MAG: LysR family transcriptional regulator [Nitrococcus mobilis]|nr:LysR family transcriptional regulator [Nitrococcus mobilis]